MEKGEQRRYAVNITEISSVINSKTQVPEWKLRFPAPWSPRQLETSVYLMKEGNTEPSIGSHTVIVERGNIRNNQSGQQDFHYFWDLVEIDPEEPTLEFPGRELYEPPTEVTADREQILRRQAAWAGACTVVAGYGPMATSESEEAIKHFFRLGLDLIEGGA